MVKEAAANAEADRKAREAAELRNKADQAIYQTERAIKDLGDKVTEDEKNDLNGKIAELRRAVESDDADRVNRELTALQEATYALTSRLYQQTAQQEQGANGAGDPGTNGHNPGGATAANDDVIDADFKTEA
jgi:molecular chaperone DnaK